MELRGDASRIWPVPSGLNLIYVDHRGPPPTRNFLRLVKDLLKFSMLSIHSFGQVQTRVRLHVLERDVASGQKGISLPPWKPKDEQISILAQGIEVGQETGES